MYVLTDVEFLSTETLTCPKDAVSAQSSQYLTLKNLSASSSAIALNLARKECSIDVSLMADLTTDTDSLHFDQL